MPMNAEMFHRDSLDLDLSSLVSEVNNSAMTFYTTDSPFKLEHTFTVKIHCKHATFSLELSTDELF